MAERGQRPGSDVAPVRQGSFLEPHLFGVGARVAGTGSMRHSRRDA